MYASAPDMLLFFQARELAKIATPRDDPKQAQIDPVLLETLINQGDTSAWTPEQIERAQKGVIAINACLEDASKEMDSYFIRRYPLPLDNETIALNPIKRKCADVTRYLLAERFFKDLDEVRRRYDDVVTWLRDVSAGRVGLLIAIPSGGVTGSFGSVVVQGVSKHDWSCY